MTKVKLTDWKNRWSYDSFSISKGQIKDCPDEIIALAGDRLVIVHGHTDPEKKTRPDKKENKKHD